MENDVREVRISVKDIDLENSRYVMLQHNQTNYIIPEKYKDAKHSEDYKNLFFYVVKGLSEDSSGFISKLVLDMEDREFVLYKLRNSPRFLNKKEISMLVEDLKKQDPSRILSIKEISDLVENKAIPLAIPFKSVSSVGPDWLKGAIIEDHIHSKPDKEKSPKTDDVFEELTFKRLR